MTKNMDFHKQKWSIQLRNSRACRKKTGSIDQSGAPGATFPNAALATPGRMDSMISMDQIFIL